MEVNNLNNAPTSRRAPYYMKISTLQPTKKNILIVISAFIGVLIVIYAATAVYHVQHESNLMKQYAQDPNKKPFVDQINKDKADLAQNSEKARESGILMDIGLQWYNLFEPKIAARWWKKGLKMQPDNDIGWYNLGNAYRDAKEYGNAEKAYEKSISLASGDEIDGCLALGEMYHYNYTKKRRMEDNVYLKCLKRSPNQRDLIARLALYYRDTNQKQKAILYFDKLFTIEPTLETGEELRKLRME